MKNEVIANLQTEADLLLERARHELERSEEDVTAHLVCYNSRQSLTNYLISFLLLNDIEPNKSSTIEDILDQCRGIDARFEYLDISPMNCRCEADSHAYCLAVHQVDECYQIAEQARVMVISHPPTY